MRRRIAVVLLALALMAMSACGGSGGVKVSNTTSAAAANGLTAGNWVLAATSQDKIQSGSLQNTSLLGSLAPSGEAVSGMVRASAGCLVSFANPIPENGIQYVPVSVSGSITGGNIVLTLQDEPTPANGNTQVTTTITGTISNGTNINGTYTSTGNQNSQYGTSFQLCNGDYGTVWGTLVPPVTGTWNATWPNYGYTVTGNSIPTCNGGQDCTTLVNPIADTVTVSATLDQENAAPDGSFPLSGTLTVQGLACTITEGAIDDTQSYIYGDTFLIVANATDGSGTSIRLGSGHLPNPNTAIAIQFGNPALTGTACNNNYVTGGTLTKSY
jgi:hypothetical protein